MQPFGNFYEVEAVGLHLPVNPLQADAGRLCGVEADQAGLRAAPLAPALHQRAAPVDDNGLPGFHGDFGSLNRSHRSSAFQIVLADAC